MNYIKLTKQKQQANKMNDRFKFRVIDNRDWSDDKGTMYYDAERAYDYLTDIPVNCFGNFFDDDWIVEQCTGLKDKNGNLIYEGDIIKDRGEITYKIQWKDACFVAVALDNFNYMPDSILVQTWLNTWKAEIIGNIHENKGE